MLPVYLLSIALMDGIVLSMTARYYLCLFLMLLVCTRFQSSTAALHVLCQQRHPFFRFSTASSSSSSSSIKRCNNKKSYHHQYHLNSIRGSITTETTTGNTGTTISMASHTTTLSFIGEEEEKKDGSIPSQYDSTVLIGKKDVLQSLIDRDASLSSILLKGPNNNKSNDDAAATTTTAAITAQIIASMMESAKPKKATTSFLPTGQKLAIGVLPCKVSRNNHPMSVHVITDLVASTCTNNNNNNNKSRKMMTRLILAGSNAQEASPAILASAIAKAFPLYSRKTNGQNDDNDNNDTKDDTVDASSSSSSSSSNSAEHHVHVSFLDETGNSIMTDQTLLLLHTANIVANNVRLAARLVDMTPAELTTTAYAAKVKAIVKDLSSSSSSSKNHNVTFQEIVGEDLRQAGYGGLYGVGKAAECPPRLLVLQYTPPASSSSSSSPVETVALVGKGIVYDTGGLSLKPKTGMAGMKGDMGGSAGLLGAFVSAVQLQVPKKITLILCLAENAIGATAFRNDDILTLYSGKTVEVNNCDAEGRLVLGDGVAHATKHIEGLDLVIDMATLTGAQAVATGKKHASVLANSAELEQRAVTAGLRSGDLCYPILYAPELLMAEFDSKVADMKNSVADRSNAQTSCAGHFIEQHLHKDYKGGWLHIDMAAPSCKAERGTGYGVGLILSLLEAPGF